MPVLVSDNVDVTLDNDFLYDAATIPIVTSIVPKVLSVLGKETIYVNVSNIDLSSRTLVAKINQTVVKIQKISTDQFTFVSPGMKPGVYEFTLSLGNDGNARVTDTIEYSLYVTSFTPNFGSLRGRFFFLYRVIR